MGPGPVGLLAFLCSGLSYPLSYPATPAWESAYNSTQALGLCMPVPSYHPANLSWCSVSAGALGGQI